MMTLFAIGFQLGILILTAPQRDHTLYIDPGSGSFIFQLIIATLLGAAFILKAYWRKITGFLRSIFKRDSGNSNK